MLTSNGSGLSLVIDVKHVNKYLDAVNVMRPSEFGNPFVIGRDGTRQEVVEKYRVWLWQRLQKDPEFRMRVKALHGKTLVCCCAPKLCHADVLARAAKWLNRKPE